MGGGNDEREQTLNQLLTEMDGFEGNSGIIIVAATNRPDVLDSALMRPGRFDRQVTVDRPDYAGRLQILNVHAKDKTLSIASLTSSLLTLSRSFLAASIAASFKRLAKSAPVNPGVLLATLSKSTSFERVLSFA